jgi:GNAT superfamily N-acetyltransferase
MELWQMDVMGGVALEDGTECKVITGIDDHSRFCVIAKLVVRATARPVCEALLEALERHGVPGQILTDNGKIFTGRLAAHPHDEPHYYLSLLAADPRHRGHGFGMALLAENLAEVDRDGKPAYLESTNPENDHRYERQGFVRCGDFTVPSGPRVGTMWREARDHS